MKINQVFNDFILVLEHPHTLQTQSLHYSANQLSPIPLYTFFLLHHGLSFKHPQFGNRDRHLQFHDQTLETPLSTLFR